MSFKHTEKAKIKTNQKQTKPNQRIEPNKQKTLFSAREYLYILAITTK